MLDSHAANKDSVSFCDKIYQKQLGKIVNNKQYLSHPTGLSARLIDAPINLLLKITQKSGMRGVTI